MASSLLEQGKLRGRGLLADLGAKLVNEKYGHSFGDKLLNEESLKDTKSNLEPFYLENFNVILTTNIWIICANQDSTKDLIFKASENELSNSKQNAKNTYTIIIVL